MTSERTPKRFSLLVGASAYLNGSAGDARELTSGQRVSLTNLQGAANDVESMSELLRNLFSFDETTTLVSSPSSTDSRTPREPNEKWPTHDNIKREFVRIWKESEARDVFLFYFAGHGALLNTIAGRSPNDGRSKDPSLLTTDYCCAKPAIRGWELNNWLEDFNRKGVRVIVILDSCHSGGAWRDSEHCRTPEDWITPPNLPSDESILQGTKGKPGHRDGEMEVSWDINPRDFTLMGACESDQKAAEIVSNESTYGAFTLALHKCLKEDSNIRSTYRYVRDRTANQLASWSLTQTPRIFGDDRLAFLEDYEPITATPVMGTVENDIVYLSVGQIHSVHRGTLYVSRSSPAITVKITKVNECTSIAKIVDGERIKDSSEPLQLLPHRWSKAENLDLTVDPNLGSDFLQHLNNELSNRLVGQFTCLCGPQETNEQRTEERTERFKLHLQKENDGIDIRGQRWLFGNEGHIRDWKVGGQNDKDKATNSAIALSHLFRFGQILQLQNSSRNSPPFEITITERDKQDRLFEYEFENTGKEELHFVVFILSSGFHIKQLRPTSDTATDLRGGNCDSFKFCLKPPKLPGGSDATENGHTHRDIVRTVVMRGKRVSMKSIELPEIWHAGYWEEQSTGPGRNGELVDDFHWWVHDQPLKYVA